MNAIEEIKALTDEVLDDYNSGKYTKEELDIFLEARNKAIDKLEAEIKKKD